MTLLELLVALAIFGILGTAGYSGLQTVLAAREAVAAQAERLAALQLAWHFIERDLEQAAARPVRDEFGLQRPALTGGVAADPLLALTRAGWDNPLAQPRAGLQRVGYRLQEARLWRLHWPVLDRGGRPQPQQAALLDGVTAVGLRYLDRRGTWHRRWPPVDAGDGDQALARLPRAVEFRLELEDWGEFTRLLRLAGDG